MYNPVENKNVLPTLWCYGNQFISLKCMCFITIEEDMIVYRIRL